jgi:hypothetical protein
MDNIKNVIPNFVYICGSSVWFKEKFTLISKECKSIFKELYEFGVVNQIREIIKKTFNGDEESQRKWIDEFLLVGFRTKLDNDRSFMKIYSLLIK